MQHVKKEREKEEKVIAPLFLFKALLPCTIPLCSSLFFAKTPPRLYIDTSSVDIRPSFNIYIYIYIYIFQMSLSPSPSPLSPPKERN
ncbi:hypothetical protein V8C37DRAFT_386828, partial [Trichoderma ceciliae]